MRHAIIENDTKTVVNIVLWEGKEWLPPRNHLVIQDDNASIGDTWNEVNKVFIKNKNEVLSNEV